MRTTPAWQIRGRLFLGRQDLLTDQQRLSKWLKVNAGRCAKSVHVQRALDQINAELQAIAFERQQAEFALP